MQPLGLKDMEKQRVFSMFLSMCPRIDAHPFMQFYQKKYGVDLGKKKKGAAGASSRTRAISPRSRGETAPKELVKRFSGRQGG